MARRMKDFENKIKSINNKINIFYSKYTAQNSNKFLNENILAFAGIGNPENFFDLLKENNINVEKQISFPDHYNYSQKELDKLLKISKENNLKLLTTEKDFFRIKHFNITDIDYLTIKLEIINEELFEKELKKAFDMKIIKYFIQAFIIYIFFILIKILGLNISRKLFAKIFQIIGPLIKSEKTINENLEKFLSSYNEEQKKNIKKTMWSNYGKTFVEYLFLNKFRENNSHINIKGKEILKSIINKNKPVIFVSGHFANFELMSMELTRETINLATIYRPLNNLFLNPFMEYVRRTYVCRNQIKKGIAGVKDSINYLKKNYSIALMIDQRVSEGKRLPFFDQMALTTTLPAQLAIKFNLEIVPIYIKRNLDDSFEMEILKPIALDKNEDLITQKINTTIKLNKILEEMISRDPGQWIWTHNRWK
jgi:KDO2-lipid IV(A) lauroyltransferase